MGFRVMVGIDPGTTGALALFVDGALQHVGRLPVVKRKATIFRKGGVDLDTSAFTDQVRKILRDHVGLTYTATIEEVGEKAVGRCGAISLAKLARIAALAEGVLVTLGFVVHRVPPLEWKIHHGLKGAEKMQAITVTRRRYPWLVMNTKASIDLAEAVLIGEYGVATYGDR